MKDRDREKNKFLIEINDVILKGEYLSKIYVVDTRINELKDLTVAFVAVLTTLLLCYLIGYSHIRLLSLSLLCIIFFGLIGYALNQLNFFKKERLCFELADNDPYARVNISTDLYRNEIIDVIKEDIPNKLTHYGEFCLLDSRKLFENNERLLNQLKSTRTCFWQILSYFLILIRNSITIIVLMLPISFSLGIMYIIYHIPAFIVIGLNAINFPIYDYIPNCLLADNDFLHIFLVSTAFWAFSVLFLSLIGGIICIFKKLQ